MDEDFESVKTRYFNHLSLYLSRPTNLDVIDKLKNSELGQNIVKCTIDFVMLEAFHKKFEDKKLEEKKEP